MSDPVSQHHSLGSSLCLSLPKKPKSANKLCAIPHRKVPQEIINAAKFSLQLGINLARPFETMYWASLRIALFRPEQAVALFEKLKYLFSGIFNIHLYSIQGGFFFFLVVGSLLLTYRLFTLGSGAWTRFEPVCLIMHATWGPQIASDVCWRNEPREYWGRSRLRKKGRNVRWQRLQCSKLKTIKRS